MINLTGPRALILISFLLSSSSFADPGQNAIHQAPRGGSDHGAPAPKQTGEHPSDELLARKTQDDRKARANSIHLAHRLDCFKLLKLNEKDFANGVKSTGSSGTISLLYKQIDSALTKLGFSGSTSSQKSLTRSKRTAFTPADDSGPDPKQVEEMKTVLRKSVCYSLLDEGDGAWELVRRASGSAVFSSAKFAYEKELEQLDKTKSLKTKVDSTITSGLRSVDLEADGGN